MKFKRIKICSTGSQTPSHEVMTKRNQKESVNSIKRNQNQNESAKWVSDYESETQPSQESSFDSYQVTIVQPVPGRLLEGLVDVAPVEVVHPRQPHERLGGEGTPGNNKI